MWYLIKCLLKVQVDEVHCFLVTSVIGVNDMGKEVKQACSAASLVSEAMLRVTYQVVALKVCPERIVCILCMRLGVCRFCMHLTALIHLK